MPINDQIAAALTTHNTLKKQTSTSMPFQKRR